MPCPSPYSPWLGLVCPPPFARMGSAPVPPSPAAASALSDSILFYLITHIITGLLHYSWASGKWSRGKNPTMILYYLAYS